jgi:probable F420-dependent oxidoreductase
MRFGVGIPSAGSVTGTDVIRFVQRAEALGFESLWTGDHLILPTEGTTQYPYTPDGSFPLASTENFFEPFTLLAYAAAVTKTVKIGATVIIVPYRNPIVQAKMLACLDVLSAGRLICGVGVGWLEKEFQVLGASYKDRGPVTDEYIQVFKTLWTEERPAFQGRFCEFDGIAMYPKPLQKPHPPIWVGGHSKAAVRRSVRHGDAWHPTRPTTWRSACPTFATKPSALVAIRRALRSRSSARCTSPTSGCRAKCSAAPAAASSARPKR